MHPQTLDRQRFAPNAQECAGVWLPSRVERGGWTSFRFSNVRSTPLIYLLLLSLSRTASPSSSTLGDRTAVLYPIPSPSPPGTLSPPPPNPTLRFHSI